MPSVHHRAVNRRYIFVPLRLIFGDTVIEQVHPIPIELRHSILYQKLDMLVPVT